MASDSENEHILYLGNSGFAVLTLFFLFAVLSVISVFPSDVL